MPIIEQTVDSLIPPSDPGWELLHYSQFMEQWSDEVFGRMERYNTNPELWGESLHFVKSYEESRRVSLDRNAPLPTVSLVEAIAGRKSSRAFDLGAQVTLEQLSGFLRLAYSELPGRDAVPRRTIPSGGGRYPLELYVFARAVKGVQPGLYHYNIRRFELESVEPARTVEQLREAYSPYGGMLESAAFSLWVTVVPDRTNRKYGLRGWRFVMMECGFLGQNIYLASSALGFGCCAVGGGWDPKVADFIGVNRSQEFPMLALAVGPQMVPDKVGLAVLDIGDQAEQP